MKFLLKESWRDREADGHGCRHTCMAGRSPVSRLRVDDDGVEDGEDGLTKDEGRMKN